jgi:uncharacterized protein (TIGR02453 family)
VTTGGAGSAGFAGWPDEALEFYEGLEADNTKAYWDPRKAIYERSVKAPMEALLAEVEAEWGPFKIMRPYRDVRFSADKTPYKTFIGAGSRTQAAGVYTAFSARGVFAGAGIWHLSKDQLVRYRDALDGPAGERLEEVGTALVAAGFDLEGETLKRAPKGWATDHPRIKLLRHTTLIIGRQFAPAAWMATPEAKTRVVEVWRAARPLNAWLDANVGPAETPPR